MVPEYFLRALKHATGWPGVHILAASSPGAAKSPETAGTYQISIVTNIRLYAGGYAHLSPHARLDDGEMDLWLIQGKGLRDACRNAWSLLRTTHVDSKFARRVAFSQISLTLDAPAPLHIDGDPLPEAKGVEITVRAKDLKVIIPASAPQDLFI